MVIGKALEILRKDGLNGFAERLKRRITRRLEKKHSALTVTHNEAMKWYERRKDEYERLITAVCPYVSNDAIIFDIGANIGYFTLLLTERLNFKGSAYLFEPVPHLAELCKTTFCGVTFSVTVFDFGLSDGDTEEDIFIANNGNLGWNTLVSQMTTADMTKIRIRLKTFDTCGIDVTPSFIKVDVEGAEYKVFRGMLGSLRKWHPLPVVLCEVGWGQSHPAWEEELSLLVGMKRIGYTICDLNGLPIDENNLQGTTDVLFIPKKA
jgi:FkbM family methyltransferase